MKEPPLGNPAAVSRFAAGVGYDFGGCLFSWTPAPMGVLRPPLTHVYQIDNAWRPGSREKMTCSCCPRGLRDDAANLETHLFPQPSNIILLYVATGLAESRNMQILGPPASNKGHLSGTITLFRKPVFKGALA